MPNREGRILGGEYLSGHEFPWLVTIPIKGIISSIGVLINDQYVLTAASTLIGYVVTKFVACKIRVLHLKNMNHRKTKHDFNHVI